MNKVATGTWSLVLFTWNNPLVADVNGSCTISALEAGLASISGVLNISDDIQFLDHDKSNSISQLIID